MRSTSLILLAATVACAVETSTDDSFGDVTGNGTDVSTTMRLTAAEDSGSDDGNSTVSAAATSSNDESDTAPAECPADRQCISAVPDDWYGPLAVHMGDEDETPPECPESFPNAGPTMVSGYTDPGPAVCECECLLDVTSSCYSYVYDMDGSCSSYESFYMISMDCQPAAVDGGAYFYMFLQGTPTCHSEVTDTIPPPIWDNKVMSCRDPVEGQECSTGVCMPVAPEGFEAGLCIYREGNHNCPEGDYSVRYSHHAGVDDSRSCSYCGCGSGSASCTGDLQVYQSGDCTGASQNAALNVCTPGITGGQSVSIAFTGDGGCPVATPPEAQGEIAVMGETTYCCTQ